MLSRRTPACLNTEDEKGRGSWRLAYLEQLALWARALAQGLTAWVLAMA